MASRKVGCSMNKAGHDKADMQLNRERKTINELLYADYPSREEVDSVKSQQELDAMNASDHDLLAIALGAPARQVLQRAQEIGPQTGWRDGYLSVEHGFCPPDYEEPIAALARSPGRIWSDLCERMPGCCARGRVREAVAALPLVEGTEENIPDEALWGAVVALGMLCSIYRFEDKHDGKDGLAITDGATTKPQCPMGDDLSSYNLKIRDVKSNTPYLARFDNTDLRWPMFGERAEVAFLKGCADTSASFQHGPDAIAACQEHVMTGNIEGLLHEMIRLKEILERMPNAFHSISPNPNAGDNYVSADKWVRWGLFSSPLSKRVPAASGLQFPPYLVMDAFLGRKTHASFLGVEALHLRAWLPSNHRAFIAAIQYHYSIPEFVQRSGDPRLMGVLEGIVEAYAGERGFMGVHRYKVFGILEVAAKTGRTATNGLSGAADATRPWEETHRQFSDAMKERLEPFRGKLAMEPHSMRGTFEECRYMAKIASCSSIDQDANRSTAMVTLDIRDTGITFAPGDRVAVMPLNSWEECAKMVAALGLDQHVREPVDTTGTWSRFEHHLSTVTRTAHRQLTVIDILRRGHLAPITKELTVKVHELLHASSNTVLQVLATEEWPVRGSLGDLLQKAVLDTPSHIWNRAFNLEDLSWLSELVQLEVPRTYSISSHSNELLPSTVDLTISRAEYELSPIFSQRQTVTRAGVASGFFNPRPLSAENSLLYEVLIGVSRPVAFQLPIDKMVPCAFFAGGSGIAPFRSFWQHRLATSGLSGGRNLLYLGVQSREKFCYEAELRELVNMGFMEVHLAFSRDRHGLAYDGVARDLVEKPTPPRYIDSLIVEQGNAICDMVMSKKQGGLGGHLYVCGSVSVFDSVMSGIRKAMYNYRTATMETVDLIINKAFAERRFMLDVFMSPKALPCNLPTISLSSLALHTGHRQESRMWIAVHGSVYDITDFCPMHPGGTLIIKSNAGVDCTKSFDNLAHTNNPEVSSLLTRYFIEACNGMDAFESIATVLDSFDGSNSDSTPVAALSSFLLQTLERMAHRLAMFYTQLARLSVYQPELEHNPARTRWAFVRRCIRDGTFFVMTRSRNDGQSMDGQSESYYINAKSLEKTTFDNILSQIKHVITSSTAESQTTIVQPSTVNDVHHERATTLAKDGSVASSASRLNVGAVESMGSFMKKNEKAIRRLSSMPSSIAESVIQTPPSRPYETSMALKLKLEGLNRRSRGESVSSRQSFISASSAMDLRRNRSVSSARNASKRMSIDPGHTREQSAGRLLAFKLGALAGERRSFIPPTW
ncbi:Nitric oxide synthase, inducible [Fusarium oxysporum f. sp. cubense race 1]|uniref:NADPH--hemoprotein reductase n=1 Tax=Fusarium oxysporum f. sp. cubense (strain race 1) TaxID=1229664 RepID=N4UMV3_FUSC1|nr:Nitric oxide synthase, inducible [Fusarium oxysporum f. sp. cubense race 1]